MQRGGEGPGKTSAKHTSKARPMPNQTEMRRQMVAYKEQVHELRVQYGKELAAKAKLQLEAKQAAALLVATGIRYLLSLPAGSSQPSTGSISHPH